MTVPGRTEAASLLLSLDRRPVKAVALLHDIRVPAVRSRAERPEADVCGAPGIRPRDAGRPVWTDAPPRAAAT